MFWWFIPLQDSRAAVLRMPERSSNRHSAASLQIPSTDRCVVACVVGSYGFGISVAAVPVFGWLSVAAQRVLQRRCVRCRCTGITMAGTQTRIWDSQVGSKLRASTHGPETQERLNRTVGKHVKLCVTAFPSPQFRRLSKKNRERERERQVCE